jgi:uncharacterized protein CbrC (UPF0167 family)
MTVQREAGVQDIVHLLALAAKVEGKGQYNIAKLLRASADAISRRAAYGIDLPNDRDTLVEELAHVRGILALQGISHDFVDALETAAVAFAEGSLPLIADVPDPYVCRRCGHAVLGNPADTCPTCFADGATFQRFRPVYWLREFDPFEALENLRETPGKVRRLMDGLGEDILTRQPEGGGWSIRQVIAHLKDAQGVLGYRVGLLLKEDNPNLASQAVFEWANRQDAATTQELYDAYLASRQDTLKILAGASLQDWWRKGRHEEFGELRLWEQVSYFAAHEPTHLRQIAALRARFAAQ